MVNQGTWFSWYTRLLVRINIFDEAVPVARLSPTCARPLEESSWTNNAQIIGRKKKSPSQSREDLRVRACVCVCVCVCVRVCVVTVKHPLGTRAGDGVGGRQRV